MFITRRKHNIIVNDLLNRVNLFEQMEEVRKDNQKNNDKLMQVLEKLTDKTKDYLTVDSINTLTNRVSGGGLELKLPDNVAVYVPDYYGGIVIEQESTPVTILDENGKATYAVTAKKPDKGKKFILETHT